MLWLSKVVSVIVPVLFAPVLLALSNLVTYVVYLYLFLGLFKNIKSYVYCLCFYDYDYLSNLFYYKVLSKLYCDDLIC